ncbi:MAG: hypothetical protein ACREM6_08135 [Vulcanimicrobiaceae bacterium]
MKKLASATPVREHGIEATRRLRAGLPIAYVEDGVLVHENPDGRRYEVRIEATGSATFVREV